MFGEALVDGGHLCRVEDGIHERHAQEVPVAQNYLFWICKLEPNGFPESTGFVEKVLPNV